MSKLIKIIHQASNEIANLAHPNSQKIQDQLSQIQESILGEITQDLIDQTNLVLYQIQEAKLQSKEEEQIKENIKLAEQNIFSNIYRLIERNSNLKLNIELNSILEKSSIEELIAFIQSDKLKLYNKENQKLKKQTQKYQKLKTQLSNFKISEHQVSFEHHTFSIDEFIEPIIQTTPNPLQEPITQTTQNLLQKPINETKSIVLNENLKKPKNFFKLLGISTLLLSATTYLYNSNKTEQTKKTIANNIEKTQSITSNPEMEIGYLEENSHRAYDILQAREFLISLKNSGPNSSSNFDLNDYCNYSYLHIIDFQKSILIKSQTNGQISTSACIYESKTKSAYTLPTDEAFSLYNLKEYEIFHLEIKNNNNQNLEIKPINYFKDQIDVLRKQSKRLIFINNQTQKTIKELTNLKSIDQLHNYPKIMKMIIRTGLVTNKKVYSTNLAYSESNFTFLDGTKPNLDSFIVLSFRAEETNPNTLIVEFSNTDN